jgi:hypothetical protein
MGVTVLLYVRAVNRLFHSPKVLIATTSARKPVTRPVGRLMFVEVETRGRATNEPTCSRKGYRLKPLSGELRVAVWLLTEDYGFVIWARMAGCNIQRRLPHRRVLVSRSARLRLLQTTRRAV